MPIDQVFPRLTPNSYSITSPETEDYNCVAWAAHESDRWWWPDPFGIGYWPNSAHRFVTVEAFVQTFQSFGYEVCASPNLEVGFDKIAIFASPNGEPTHIARQLSNGRWTSKLGRLEDIEHELPGIEGAAYGEVAQIMRKASVNLAE